MAYMNSPGQPKMGTATGEVMVPGDGGKPFGIPAEHDGTFTGLRLEGARVLGGGRPDKIGNYKNAGTPGTRDGA